MILNIQHLFLVATGFLLVRASYSSSLRGSSGEEVDNSHHHRRTSLRIVGGSNAGKGRYSYFASLRNIRDDGTTGGHFCGAAVIAPQVVLTAAHCVGGRYSSQIRVVVGRPDFNNENEGEEINVSREIKHPEYGRVSDVAPNYDFALLILEKSVNTDEIKMLQLNDKSDIPDNTPLTVIGHGYTKAGTFSLSTTLKHLDKYAISNEDCKRSSGSGWADYANLITDQMICAEDDQTDSIEEDSCNGDSGGPLVLKGADPDGADDKEVGVVSWGYGCATVGYPGVYARVSSAYEWINKQLDENFPDRDKITTPSPTPGPTPEREPSAASDATSLPTPAPTPAATTSSSPTTPLLPTTLAPTTTSSPTTPLLPTTLAPTTNRPSPLPTTTAPTPAATTTSNSPAPTPVVEPTLPPTTLTPTTKQPTAAPTPSATNFPTASPPSDSDSPPVGTSFPTSSEPLRRR